MYTTTPIIYTIPSLAYNNKTYDVLLHEIAYVKEHCFNEHHPEYFVSLVLDHAHIKALRLKLAYFLEIELSLIVVVGMGGSSLGAHAVYTALQFADCIRAPIVFLESIDPDYVFSVKQNIQEHIDKKKRVVICSISKSGTTLETSLNTSLLVNFFNQSEYVHFIMIHDEGKHGAAYAARNEIVHISIPPSIGGRFSLYTAAGLAPLLLAGIPIDDFYHGGLQAAHDGLADDIKKNHAGAIALNVFEWYHQGYTIHDTFNWAYALQDMGDWLRQLFAESLGKESIMPDCLKERVGILPTVSTATQDLHSMYQLYMAGPFNRCTAFVSIKQWTYDHELSFLKEAGGALDILCDKPLSYVQDALLKSVQASYEEKNMPYYTIELERLTPYALGYYMQTYMMAVIYLGKLLRVNAFDQPNVEEYKKIAKEILGI